MFLLTNVGKYHALHLQEPTFIWKIITLVSGGFHIQSAVVDATTNAGRIWIITVKVVYAALNLMHIFNGTYGHKSLNLARERCAPSFQEARTFENGSAHIRRTMSDLDHLITKETFKQENIWRGSIRSLGVQVCVLLCDVLACPMVRTDSKGAISIRPRPVFP